MCIAVKIVDEMKTHPSCCCEVVNVSSFSTFGSANEFPYLPATIVKQKTGLFGVVGSFHY